MKYRVAICLAVIFAATARLGPAAAPPTPERPQEVGPAPRLPLKAKGPLAGLPSTPGPHVAKVQALGDNSWLNLGAPAPDPKWGKARGRSWTPRMPYAPALRAAFLCGCGQHGYVKPDGHFMDDLWAYDINGHRWVCVYPGADVKALSLKRDAHGLEVNDSGEHVPVSYMGHGYCNQTYIPDLNRLMLTFTHSPWWTKAMPQRWDWLDQTYDDVKRRNYGHAGPVIENPRHPLFWDVAEGRWERTFVPGEGPGDTRFEGVLEYVPYRRQVFFLYRGRVWFYDLAANTWIPSGAERVNIEYDSWGCYDSKRRRVYVARKEAFWAYDIEAGKWSAIRGEGQPEGLGSCVDGAVTYDAAGDAVLVHLRGGSGIRIYDPGKNAWTASAPPPAVEWRSRNINGFYDPVLNAHYYHLAGDSDDNGIMLVYRYRQAAAQPEAPGP